MRNQRVVAGLIVIVCGGWVLSQLAITRSAEDIAIGACSPTFRAAPGEAGTWNIDWPRWPESKGDPRLRIEGVEDPSSGEIPSFAMDARVLPEDAVDGVFRKGPPDGWLLSGTGGDPHLHPVIHLNARSIQYRVTKSFTGAHGAAYMRIYGELDELKAEANHRLSFFTVIAGLLVVALGGWLIVLLLKAPRPKVDTAPAP